MPLLSLGKLASACIYITHKKILQAPLLLLYLFALYTIGFSNVLLSLFICCCCMVFSVGGWSQFWSVSFPPNTALYHFGMSLHVFFKLLLLQYQCSCLPQCETLERRLPSPTNSAQYNAPCPQVPNTGCLSLLSFAPQGRACSREYIYKTGLTIQPGNLTTLPWVGRRSEPGRLPSYLKCHFGQSFERLTTTPTFGNTWQALGAILVWLTGSSVCLRVTLA